MRKETATSSAVSLDRNAMMPGNTQQEEPFVAVPTHEAQYAVPSDGFQLQGEYSVYGAGGIGPGSIPRYRPGDTE